MDVASASPATRFGLEPLAVHDATGALPPPVQNFRDQPIPPVLPAERGAGIDDAPT